MGELVTPPYRSLPVERRDTSLCVIERKCPTCEARVSYSGGYFVCFTCRVQMPNFPRTSEAQ